MDHRTTEPAKAVIGHPGTEDAKRVGIVTVSLGMLEQWMRIPAGTHIRDVRSKDGGLNGEFEILVEGAAIPETPLCEVTPHLFCTVTVTEPKIEFTLRFPAQRA